ncbi:hypothetical protein MKJ04_11995 [Pontibacter sp. E15-1]|uniref:hypothetical protein n=1 Tax=Pontibacter sp. E15-1 TaxID=2919918 RepID=UPI001F4F7A31|nr:hypothetical protein [Pontibacter sp. E15-1]MCJ8165563.1 hypothetical protein [Pontibacter sp. E15-1]
MKNRNRTYVKLMLALALGFSFAAEATNYTMGKHQPTLTLQADESVTQWQRELLGDYADIQSLTALNLRQAYITLLENVREKKGAWDDQDWNKAQAVINKLDARKNKLEKRLGLDDKAKIKLLQGELRALETAADAKD